MRRLAAATATALVAFAPSAAHARSPQPGVHVSPGSPAGRQYVFPVVGARNETSGTAPVSSSGGSGGPPAFGRGITPSGSSSPTGPTTSQQAGQQPGTTGARGSGSATGQAGRAHARRFAPPADLNRSSEATGASAGAGRNSWLALAGGGVLVLLLGGGGGVGLRRRYLRA